MTWRDFKEMCGFIGAIIFVLFINLAWIAAIVGVCAYVVKWIMGW